MGVTEKSEHSSLSLLPGTRQMVIPLNNRWMSKARPPWKEGAQEERWIYQTCRLYCMRVNWSPPWDSPLELPTLWRVSGTENSLSFMILLLECLRTVMSRGKKCFCPNARRPSTPQSIKGLDFTASDGNLSQIMPWSQGSKTRIKRIYAWMYI